MSEGSDEDSWLGIVIEYQDDSAIEKWKGGRSRGKARSANSVAVQVVAVQATSERPGHPMRQGPIVIEAAQTGKTHAMSYAPQRLAIGANKALRVAGDLGVGNRGRIPRRRDAEGQIWGSRYMDAEGTRGIMGRTHRYLFGGQSFQSSTCH